MPFAATRMDLEMIILSEVSQKEKDISYDVTYMWSLKYGAYELICVTTFGNIKHIKLPLSN